jgi:hypothetical protein
MGRNIYAEHKPTGGAGSYMKFESDKTVRVRIVSEPVIFDNIFAQGAIRQVSTKYAWVVYNLDEEEVQIMQLPKTGFRALAAIAADEDYGDPMENKYDIKITRTGQKQQTKYNIVPVGAKVELDEDTQAEIEAIDLVSRLAANQNNDRVALLSDEVDGKRPKESSRDEVHDPEEEEPMNLDDVDL